MSLNFAAVDEASPEKQGKRLVPWIVAVSFLMESLDTTILSSFQPAKRELLRELLVEWTPGAVPGFHRARLRVPLAEPGVHLSICTGLSKGFVMKLGGRIHPRPNGCTGVRDNTKVVTEPSLHHVARRPRFRRPYCEKSFLAGAPWCFFFSHR